MKNKSARRVLARFAALALAGLVPACTKHPFVPPGTSGGGGGGPIPVSWNQDVWPILVQNCQVCHTGSGAGAKAVPDMQMTDAPALYLEWVRVKSDCSTNLFRVLPSDSSVSLVWLMVSSSSNVCSASMPPSGNLLSSADQGTIRTWIDQGASEN